MLQSNRSVWALQHAHARGYRVDSAGRVHGPEGLRALRIRKSKTARYYVFSVEIRQPGQPVRTWPIDVHRLVAYQLHGDSVFAPSARVRHLNRNTLDNRAENIELGTVRDVAMSRAPAVRHEVAAKAGSRRGALGATLASAARARVQRSQAQCQIAAEFGVSPGCISAVVSGKSYRSNE